MKTMPERIAHAIETYETEHKAGAAAIAHKIECSPSAISQWVSGLTKNIKNDLLFKFADETRFEARWLATGDGPMRLDGGPEGDPQKHCLDLLYAALDQRGRAAVLRVAQSEREYVTPPPENQKSAA